MGNASILGLAIPLIPITLVFGSGISYLITISGGLAGTAAAWYWVLNREFRISRPAAALAGFFCAFAPPVVSHANAHSNFTALFLIPFIVRTVFRLRDPKRVPRNGVTLGLLIIWQVFIGEEALLFAALGLGCFCLGYASLHRGRIRLWARPFLTGLGIAAGVSIVLLAYPLWFQFLGPRHWSHLQTPRLYNDVAALTGYSTTSLGHQPGSRVIGRLATNPTEQNAFFGLSLYPLLALAAAMTWHQRAARTCSIITALFLALSLGDEIVISGWRSGISGPWRLFSGLPLLDSVMPGRLTLVAVPTMGTLLAYATERFTRRDRGSPQSQGGERWHRPIWIAALIAALLPILPRPLSASPYPAVPVFFSKGTWKHYVAPGRSLVAFPVSWPSRTIHPMAWQIASGLGWNAAGGYFVGPHRPDQHGGYGADERHTSRMFALALNNSLPIPINDENRRQIREDLRWWKADAVVLSPQPREEIALTGLVGLLGPGQRMDGVWVWDVRSITR